MITVVDASFAAAFLLGEARGAAMESVLEGVRDGGQQVVVPPLFWYEMINIAAIAERRSVALPISLDDYRDRMDDLPFETEGDLAPRVRRRIASLARECGLTAYDAAYLELAERLKAARLRTFDAALLALAARFPFVTA